MLTRLQTVLIAECRLEPGKTLLVGVSGGPDSLCLLDILIRCGFDPVVAHFNHNLRPDSAADADKVEEIANTLKAPFVLGQGDVRQFAEESSLSLEEAARTLRYRFLFEQATRIGAQAVAVGHTADDQVETLLMHILRGAGLPGLKGMSSYSLPTNWSQQIPLVRPLLGVWRKEIMEYLAERRLTPMFDTSNLDTRFYRNRLRHELIPYLESYQEHIRAILWRTADVLGGDYAIIEGVVEDAWSKCQGAQRGDTISFARLPLHEQPRGVQRHLLRRAIGKLRPGLRDVDFQAVERGLELLARPIAENGRCDLASGLSLFLESDRVWMASSPTDLPDLDWPQIPDGERVTLPVPGRLFLPGGWELQAGFLPGPEAGRGAGGPYEARISADGLFLPLEVRGRLPGDRFRPLGMQGHSLKISDLMINLKLPQRARARWPLVVSSGEILWIPGYRLSHTARLTPATQTAIWLKMVRTGEG
jgi:tRNA(Ile)-lysidine synthase